MTLASLAMLPRVAFDVDVTSILTESNDEGRAFTALQERYDATDPITVLLTRADGGTFEDRTGMALVAAAREAYLELDAVDAVGSFLPERLPVVGTELGPEAIEALPAPLLPPLRSGPASDLLL